MQERQRVKNRKGKETVRDLTECPTLWGTESSSSIWEGCRSIREPVSVAVLDGWTDAVPLHGKITPAGNAETEERSMAHDKSGQKSWNKKAGRQGHTKGCSAFQGIRLKQGAGTGKRIVMTWKISRTDLQPGRYVPFTRVNLSPQTHAGSRKHLRTSHSIPRQELRHPLPTLSVSWSLSQST